MTCSERLFDVENYWPESPENSRFKINQKICFRSRPGVDVNMKNSLDIPYHFYLLMKYVIVY